MNSNSKTGGITVTHLILLLVFAASMNVINRFYFFIFFAVGFFCMNMRRKLHLEFAPMAMLLLLAISWTVFSPQSTTSVFAPLKPFTYILCYLMGTSLIEDDREYSSNKTAYKLFYYVVFAVALGSLCHYILNWMTNINSIDRNTVDIWTKTVLAATGQASFACVPLAVAIACLFSKNKFYIKLAAIIALYFVLSYNLILSGRTLLIIALVVVLTAFLHKLVNQKSGKALMLLLFVIVIVAIILAYQIDFLGIKTFVEDSPLYDRFFAEDSTTDLDEDGRMSKKIYHLKNMGRFLWGGANIRKEIGHSHDIFLDTYDEAGILAFIAIVIYWLITISHLIKCVRDKTLSFTFRQVVLCIYVACYLEFFVEPILQGMPFFFASFCLIDGYVSRIVTHNKAVRKIGR